MASGWNRSSSDNEVQAKKQGGGMPTYIKGIVAGLIVVVLGAAVAWLFWPEGEVRQDAASTKRSRIKEVEPAAAPKAEVKTNVVKKLRPQEIGEIRNGYRLLANGKLHRVKGVSTSHVARVTLADKIFECSTDRTIGNMLTVRPGTGMIGDSSMYFNTFEKNFRKSLKTEIVINPDDTDEVRELKEAVRDTRADLKARMDAGEDIAQVMRDAREELRQLSVYRDELTKEVERIASDPDKDFSDKDMDDLIGAANAMLAERGVKPLTMNSRRAFAFRARQIKRQQREREAKLQDKKEE